MSDYPAQKAQYERDGYTIFEDILDAEMLAMLREQCDRFIACEDARMDAAGISPRGRRYLTHGCQAKEPEFRRMLLSRTMADVCRATLGPDAYLFGDGIIVKGPQSPGSYGFHQDSGLLINAGAPPSHKPYLVCWMPLDDMTAQNGTLRVLPFSLTPEWKPGPLPHVRDPGTNDLVIPTDDGSNAIPLEAKAGSIVAHSSVLVHDTGSNRTDGFRRVYLAQYTAEPMLERDSPHLRQIAVSLLRHGGQMMFA